MIQTIEDYKNTVGKLRSIVKAWGKSEVYLVGGCVRDELLGLVPKDIDIVVDYPDGATEFTNFLRTTYQLDVCRDYTVFPKFGTSRFSLYIGGDKWIPIECVMPRSEVYEGTTRKPSSVEFGTLEEDARRRDFCCNALYQNVLSSEVLDPTGNGLGDLKKKILRTPIDPDKTFLDDPLRMLRAIRFSVCKGFAIDPQTYYGISPNDGWYILSKERIQDEINKIILSSNPIGGLRMLQERGLLKHIFPVLSLYWGHDQKSKYHNLDLTEHTFKVLEGVLGVDCKDKLELRLSAIYHDLGKIRKQTNKGDGTYSYFQHEKASSEIAESELGRLKYSRYTIDLVKLLVLNHMCIKGNYSYTTGEYTGRPGQTRRIAKRMGNNLSLLMALIDSDNKAHSPEYCMPTQVASFWEHYKTDVILYKDSVPQKQPVNGNTIMTEFGVTGKTVGDIKRLFESWHLENPTLTEPDLLKKYRDKTSGIMIWVARKDDKYYVSYSCPEIDEYIVSFLPSEVYVIYSLEEWKENIGLVSGEKIELEAQKYPALYLALENKLKATEIIKNIGIVASELLGLGEFKELSLRYDNQNDLSCTIEWESGRKEFWM